MDGETADLAEDICFYFPLTSVKPPNVGIACCTISGLVFSRCYQLENSFQSFVTEWTYGLQVSQPFYSFSLRMECDGKDG